MLSSPCWTGLKSGEKVLDTWGLKLLVEGEHGTFTGEGLVRNLSHEVYAEGRHQLRWNATGQPSGTYFIRFESGINLEYRKAVKIK